MPRIVAIELLTYWFVRAECSTADEPGQVARIGGLSNFGKVSGKKLFCSSSHDGENRRCPFERRRIDPNTARTRVKSWQREIDTMENV